MENIFKYVFTSPYPTKSGSANAVRVTAWFYRLTAGQQSSLEQFLFV